MERWKTLTVTLKLCTTSHITLLLKKKESQPNIRIVYDASSARQMLLVENCIEISIQLDSQPICRVEHAKSLGLITDY